MRRLIVIFLLLLLPTQLLAESLEDLRAAHHRVALLEHLETASTRADAVATHWAAPSPDSSNPLQTVHADISDSVGSTGFYLHNFPLARLWLDYPPISLPSVYLPVVKPPLI